MKYPDSTSYYNQIELENDLKKYLGLPPYNTFTNPVVYDGHYLNCLYNKYGEGTVNKAIEQMGGISTNKNKVTLQKARDALQEIESAIRGAEYVDDTWATVDVDVLKLCRDLLHKSIGLVEMICPDNDGDGVGVNEEPVERDREMTYLEKYIEEHGAIKTETPLNCPCSYGYEAGPDEGGDCPRFPWGSVMDCVACWNRKIPKKD